MYVCVVLGACVDLLHFCSASEHAAVVTCRVGSRWGLLSKTKRVQLECHCGVSVRKPHMVDRLGPLFHTNAGAQMAESP